VVLAALEDEVVVAVVLGMHERHRGGHGIHVTFRWETGWRKIRRRSEPHEMRHVRVQD
jgi:hypothetical protein